MSELLEIHQLVHYQEASSEAYRIFNDIAEAIHILIDSGHAILEKPE